MKDDMSCVEKDGLFKVEEKRMFVQKYSESFENQR